MSDSENSRFRSGYSVCAQVCCGQTAFRKAAPFADCRQSRKSDCSRDTGCEAGADYGIWRRHIVRNPAKSRRRHDNAGKRTSSRRCTVCIKQLCRLCSCCIQGRGLRRAVARGGDPAGVSAAAAGEGKAANFIAASAWLRAGSEAALCILRLFFWKSNILLRKASL